MKSKGVSFAQTPRTHTLRQQRAHSDNRLLEDCRALVLDASFRPLAVVNWHKAVTLDVLKAVEVLEYYDCFVPTVREDYPVPAVLRSTFVMKKFHTSGNVALSRKNVMKRDKHRCVYCGATNRLTVDHLIPESRGGQFSWDNLVTACTRCNSRKGDRTLEQLGWTLPTEPKAPSMMDIRFCLDMPGNRPKEWLDYIGHLLPANQ